MFIESALCCLPTKSMIEPHVQEQLRAMQYYGDGAHQNIQDSGPDYHNDHDMKGAGSSRIVTK